MLVYIKLKHGSVNFGLTTFNSIQLVTKSWITNFKKIKANFN